MPITPELILGTGGLAAFLLVVARELWKSHLAADKRESERADRAEARLEKFLQIIDEKTDVKP